MKKSIVFAGLFATAMASQVAYADAQLATSKSCMACHGIENKLVGPAFKDVAERYASEEGAKASLIAKVKAGGSGTWGNIPMPPQGHVSDEDLETLVSWILSL